MRGRPFARPSLRSQPSSHGRRSGDGGRVGIGGGGREGEMATKCKVETDDADDPAVARWMQDERLLAVRDEQVAAERRLAELEDAEKHRRQAVEAAHEHRRRTRALVTVGGATSGDVTKAEKAAADAERAQDEHLG